MDPRIRSPRRTVLLATPANLLHHPRWSATVTNVLHPDRLFPPDPGVRDLARRIYDTTRELPIISPHGHVDPQVLARNEPLGDPAYELVTGDHYLLRMLYSQGVPLDALGVLPLGGAGAGHRVDGGEVWRTLAAHYHLFRGTPSRLWLDHTLAEVFGIEERLGPDTADGIHQTLCEALATEAFRPRALMDRFGIEFLATTDAATDPLDSHAALAAAGWHGRVVPTFRPDGVVDPADPRFGDNLALLAEITGEDTSAWAGYLAALRSRRRAFSAAGASASDHGPPTARTADLPPAQAAALFDRVRSGDCSADDAELFRAQMLTEFAAMSLDDGLVLQLHAGSWRRHNPGVTATFGPDMGADIPTAMDYVGGLKPLLDRFGNEPALTIVVYTLDESTYSRELAPLAGHYPALRLGPPWWFHDSPEGMNRFRRRTTGTAGFANTVGFNDDARSLLTIPARHDVARRMDAAFLAQLVAEHQLDLDEALEVAHALAYGLARSAFRVP